MDGGQFIATSPQSDRLRPNNPRPGAGSSRFLQRDLSEQALQPKPEPEPALGPADLEAARQQGIAEGHAAGLAAAAASREQAIAACLATIETDLAASKTRSDDIARASAASLAHALVQAQGAVMPSLLARSALGETNAMLDQVLPGLAGEPVVHIEVPADIASGVQAAIDRLPAEVACRLIVSTPPGLAPGDTRLRWATGHALRQPAAIWQKIMDLLEAALEHPDMEDNANGK